MGRPNHTVGRFIDALELTDAGVLRNAPTRAAAHVSFSAVLAGDAYAAIDDDAFAGYEVRALDQAHHEL